MESAQLVSDPRKTNLALLEDEPQVEEFPATYQSNEQSSLYDNISSTKIQKPYRQPGKIYKRRGYTPPSTNENKDEKPPTDMSISIFEFEQKKQEFQ